MSEIKTLISNNILPVELRDIPTIMKGEKGDPGRDGSFTQKAYKTYASMIADKGNIPTNTSVLVNNDPDKDKNAFYTYEGSVFTKSDFDPQGILTTVDVRLNQAVESASEYFQSQVATAVDNSLAASNAAYNSAIENNKTYWDGIFTQSVASKDNSFDALMQRINTDSSNLLTGIDGRVSSVINAAIDGVAIDANLVTDSLINTQGGVSQRTLNIGLNSISEMLALPLAFNGMRVFVKGLQGGTFIYDNTKTAINDGGYILSGWVRQLELPKVTPEMFGAKGDGITDDADAIRRCVAACLTNKIKAIIFSGKYLIDSPRVKGQETLLIMSPNISYIGIGGTEFIVGDSIPDKFHILAAVHNIVTTPDVGNVIISGIKFTSQSSAANMSEYTSNLAIHTFGLNNVLIQNCTFDKLDLSNVIACGVQYEGVSYGSKVVIRDNKILSVTAENTFNEDHSSIYMEAPNSFVVDNLFQSSTLQNRKVACGVECHANHITVARNQIYGYSRGVWLAAMPKEISYCQIINNRAHVSNHFVIITSTSVGGVHKCNIEDNFVRCEHATSESLFITYQGLLHTSGLLDPLGWTPCSEIVVRNNQLNIDLAVDQKFAVIANIDQFVSVLFIDNICYGAVAGLNTNTMAGSAVIGNKFFNNLTLARLNKDFFIQVSSTSFNDSQISGNTFYFREESKPSYLIGIVSVQGGNFSNNEIVDNSYGTNYKPNTDLFLPTGGLSLTSNNKIDVGIYNIELSVPALTVGKEVVKSQNIIQNVDGMYVYLDVIPDNRFYMLVDKGIASTSFVSIRLKGLQEVGEFTVPLKNVRVKTM